MHFKHPKQRVISRFMLAMINIAILLSLRGFIILAESGLTLVFLLSVACVFFFFPASFVSAELATGWPKQGGIFAWVSEAFGEKWGFVATWLQWIQNVVWYPTILAFLAATISYVFDPKLAENKFYNIAIILIVYWGATLINFKGMKVSGWVSSVCVVAGTLLPAVLLIILGCYWMIEQNPIEITLSWQGLLPKSIQKDSLVFFTGIILLLAGVEVSAVHAKEVENPQKNYPRAIFIAALITFILFLIGSLSIAIIVPKQELSLTAGLLQAFSYYLHDKNIDIVVPIIALLIAIGSLGQISSWILGPSKGIYAIAASGDLPNFFQKLNKNKVPVNILLCQGGIVTMLSGVYLFMPTVSSSYWLLTVLVAQLYVIMYLFLFAAGIYLRYKKPNQKRPFKVPGKMFGMWVCTIFGVASSLFTLIIGFFPPERFHIKMPIGYTLFLLTGILVLAAIPLFIFSHKNPRWKKRR